jgi:hypothetical protein
MLWIIKFKNAGALLAGALLASAVGSQAQTPGANVLVDPTLPGQSPNFQANGQITYDTPPWTYINLSGSSLVNGASWLVSQNVQTTDLYYYDITFSLDTAGSAQGADFAIFWNDSTVAPTANLSPGSALINYSFQETAVGSNSEVGLLGNSAFWSDVSGLDVFWTGGIDPPPVVPDSPIGLGWEAALFLGLCGWAGIQSRQATRSTLQKAASTAQ